MIDWTRVSTLRDELGAEDFDEVVDLFFEEAHEILNKLAHTPAFDLLEQDLHFLKGSSLGIGFAHFAELCQAGETQSGHGGARGVDLSGILASFTKSKCLFLKELPTRYGG